MKPLVSIHCMVYNHAKYLRNCLDGFVKQKTSFSFIAVVHDDASTDNSRHIIEEYASKYPEIISPYYEEENQWQKHDGQLQKKMLEWCTGKYVAFCEGDDYWTDPLKLQKQVDFLEKNSEYTMCFHNAYIENFNIGKIIGKHKIYKKNQDAKIIHIFRDGGFIPTASIMIRRDILNSNYMSFPPNKLVGDIRLQMYAAICGKVRYLNEIMSVYRRNNNSVTAADITHKDKAISKQNYFISWYKEVDSYTNYKYSDEISKSIAFCEGRIIRLEELYYKLWNPRYWAFILSFSNSTRMGLITAMLGLTFVPKLGREIKRIFRSTNIMFTTKRLIKSNQWLFHSMKSVLLYVRYAKSLTQSNRYGHLPVINAAETFQIGEKNYHCWFGYYDKSPMNWNNRYIAFTKVKKSAKPGDECDVCVYDTRVKTTTLVGKTTAWNWQQGCMPQWVDETNLRYNAFVNQSGQYVTRIVNVETNEVKTYSRACYAANKDHTAYLSLNFFRLDVYAKGYGYPFEVDSMNNNVDGIWETTLSGNKVELLLPLQKIIGYNKHYDDDCQHYINHVTYCPDENLIMFIHRWQKTGSEFTSRLLMYNRVSGELDTLLDNGHVSHYCWKTNDVLMIYATNTEGQKGYMTVNLKTKETKLIEGLPKEDGHPTYSNDGATILTDTYPNAHRDQYLFLFDTATKELKVLDKLYSPFKYFNDERCDFHPRWSMDCKYVMIDNTNEGRRTIKAYKLK